LDMAGAETLLDVRQVAEVLKLSAVPIRRWVLTGYIPCKKIGRAVRFSAAEIQDWAESKRAGPAQPHAQGYERGSE
jgi:excisionase family DNA binding protein